MTADNRKSSIQNITNGLALCAIIGIGIAVTWPAWNLVNPRTPDPQRRILKQLGVALNAYNDAWGTYPVWSGPNEVGISVLEDYRAGDELPSLRTSLDEQFVEWNLLNVSKLPVGWKSTADTVVAEGLRAAGQWKVLLSDGSVTYLESPESLLGKRLKEYIGSRDD